MIRIHFKKGLTGSNNLLRKKRLILLITESSLTSKKLSFRFLAMSEEAIDSAWIIPNKMEGMILSWVFLILGTELLKWKGKCNFEKVNATE
mgnify:CR=1 FL=1